MSGHSRRTSSDWGDLYTRNRIRNNDSPRVFADNSVPRREPRSHPKRRRVTFAARRDRSPSTPVTSLGSGDDPQRTYGTIMKALFLGNVAADTAHGIKRELPPSLRVEIVADPQELMQMSEVAADTDILITNHWRAEYPPAPRVRLVQSVATGTELIDIAALPRWGNDLQRFRPPDRDCRIRADDHARLEPSVPRDRGGFPHPFLMACKLGPQRTAAWRDPRQYGRDRRARAGRARGGPPCRGFRLPGNRRQSQPAAGGRRRRSGLSADRARRCASGL